MTCCENKENEKQANVGSPEPFIPKNTLHKPKSTMSARNIPKDSSQREVCKFSFLSENQKQMSKYVHSLSQNSLKDSINESFKLFEKKICELNLVRKAQISKAAVDLSKKGNKSCLQTAIKKPQQMKESSFYPLNYEVLTVGKPCENTTSTSIAKNPESQIDAPKISSSKKLMTAQGNQLKRKYVAETIHSKRKSLNSVRREDTLSSENISSTQNEDEILANDIDASNVLSKNKIGGIHESFWGKRAQHNVDSTSKRRHNIQKDKVKDTVELTHSKCLEIEKSINVSFGSTNSDDSVSTSKNLFFNKVVSQLLHPDYFFIL